MSRKKNPSAPKRRRFRYPKPSDHDLPPYHRMCYALIERVGHHRKGHMKRSEVAALFRAHRRRWKDRHAIKRKAGTFWNRRVYFYTGFVDVFNEVWTVTVFRPCFSEREEQARLPFHLRKRQR